MDTCAHPASQAEAAKVLNGHTALLSVGQMGDADRLTIAAGVPAIEMMARAGLAVAGEIRRRWAACPVVVLCGSWQ